jgi:hypothetical protein
LPVDRTRVPPRSCASGNCRRNNKEIAMRFKLMWGVVGAVVLIAAVEYSGRLMATPGSGFSASTIAQGRFDDIDVASQILREFGDATPRKDLWLSLQKTKGPSDLFVQSNLWVPGGHTGWHTHPGHSLIIVTEGAITAYDGHDPTCTPKVYTAGMGIVDEGGDHIHNLRNEGTVNARTVAVQLIPAGATRRIDAPASGHCPF